MTGGQQSAVERALRAAGQLRDAMDALQNTGGAGASEDGLVRVEVDSLGAPAGLRLSPAATRLRGGDLAARIVEAFTAAHEDLASRHRAVLDALPGWDRPAGG